MKYAVISFGGKQFKVSEGDTFKIERQKTPLKVDVLMYSEDDNVLVGVPTLAEVEVTAAVLEEKRDKKIRVGRFKSKSRYRRVKGHRQPISIVKIEKIELKK
jgi:large subunit ribosomal protein L21